MATSNEPISLHHVSTAGYVTLLQCFCTADICVSSFSPHQVEPTLLYLRTMVKSPSFLESEAAEQGSWESSGLRQREQAVRGTSFCDSTEISCVSAHSLGFGRLGKTPLCTHPAGPFASTLFPPSLSSKGSDRHTFRLRCSQHVK